MAGVAGVLAWMTSGMDDVLTWVACLRGSRASVDVVGGVLA